MIAIAAEEFAPSGHMLIDGVALEDSIPRRITRRRTLDGGVVLIDNGYSHGDRTVTVEWKPRSASELEQAQFIMQTYQTVLAVLPDGVYRSAIESVTPSTTAAQIRLLLTSKVSA
jgi:hypothetical protein